ncbi:MAG: DUF3052 domain-containing protein [Chloroflexi bacterium]|nr:DUF3052 domain-containing protein [Chloroflexota bacterium]
MGIKENSVVVLVGAPDDFEATLGELPKGVTLRRGPRGRGEVTLWFLKRRKELGGRIDKMGTFIGEGTLWVIWPKKASKVAGDLTQPVVRKIGLDSGLVDFKVCSVDEVWTGLCFTRRKKK